MNRKKLMDALTNIREEYIEEAVVYQRSRTKRNQWHLSAIAACIIISIGIGLWASGLFAKAPDTGENKVWPVKYVEKENDYENESPKPWEEWTDSERYHSFSMGDAQYTSVITALDKGKIGESLGDYVIYGQKPFTNEQVSKSGKAYAIEGISTECAVAIQFAGEDDYFAYTNTEYRTETLGQLLDNWNLTEILSFGSIYYDKSMQSTIEFVDLDSSVIWDMLLCDRSTESVGDWAYGAEMMRIDINSSLFDSKKASLEVTEAGYLITHLFNIDNAFFIGEDKAQEFINYVIINCQGFELVYVDNAE